MNLRNLFAMGLTGAALSLTALCQAQIVYNTPMGAMAGGQPVNAMATFTVSNGSVHIVLVNNQVDPRSVSQNVSDLSFTVSSGQTSGTLVSSSGMERTVAGNGTYTNGPVVSTGWGLDPNLHLNDLGHAGPKHTLIGSPDGMNVYGNANASIAGNGPHNPFLAGPSSFDINIAGLLSSADITSVIFSFGTESGSNVTGVRGNGGGDPNGNVPEPGSIALLSGLGVTGSLFAVSRLRRRK